MIEYVHTNLIENWKQCAECLLPWNCFIVNLDLKWFPPKTRVPEMIGLVTSYQKSHEIQGPISLQTQDLQTSLTRIILKKSSRTGHVQRWGMEMERPKQVHCSL